MFQFMSVFWHYLVQVSVRSAMNQYSFYIVLDLGAVHLCIARISYSNVAGWLAGCLSQPLLYQND